MDQFKDFADDRLINACIYCGGLIETKDHVPSRVFLDSPFPTNLPVLPACFKCNNGFSPDEEYVACLIESVIAGSANPDGIRRPRVAKILRRSPALRARIEQAKRIDGKQVRFEVEATRVRNIILKLARGHAAYELSLPCRKEPKFVNWVPLPLMTEEERASFEACHIPELFDEVGSRGLQRMLVTQMVLKPKDGTSLNIGFLVNNWVEVQENRYEYLAFQELGEIRVKIILAGYLACEVIWDS